MIGDDLIGCLLEQNLSALCRGLQTLGEVDRIANRGVIEKLSGAYVADDGGAGCDPNANIMRCSGSSSER